MTNEPKCTVHVHERRSRVMGSQLHLLVVHDEQVENGPDPEELLEAAEARLAELETRWTRFHPDSELSRVNAADGMPVVASIDTLTLIEGLRSAWELTDGSFDPTVHDAMLAAGYATSWPPDGPGAGGGGGGGGGAAIPAVGCWGWQLDHEQGLVQLPAGVHLDPGGLGKGLAADIVAEELLAAGAAGALVSIGGDLRAAGRPPDGSGWTIDVEDPDDPSRSIARVHLGGGGVATSTSARRRWQTPDGREAHHLIDPRTGRPAVRSVRQVTTVAGTAAWAEVSATATYLDGERPDLLAAALTLDDRGELHVLGDPEWFELPVAAGVGQPA